MIGRRFSQDLPFFPLDAQGKFGAGTSYNQRVARPFRTAQYQPAPQWVTLNASNKPSEHNFYNMLPRLVVAQLAGQMTAPDLRRRISHRIVLRPGNQSLGGT